MNTTAANILKILSQTEMSVEDMHLYLNVEKNAILKTISQINDFLESIDLPKIEKKEDIFYLILTKDQWRTLFNNFNVLTAEERIDYLYIKFIAHGFLNLEKEKEILDLSRSTILRCFQSVKDEFLKNGTRYEYLHGKGLLITELSFADKKIFHRKVMKLFIEEDILVPPLRSLLEDVKSFDTKTRLSQIYPILKFSDVSINYFLFAFLYSLEICSELFEESLYRNEDYEQTKEFKNIKLLVNKYGKDFSPKYKENLTFFLTAIILNYYYIDCDNKQKALDILEVLKDEFKISNLNKDLEKMLFHNIYLGFFKFENKIIDFKNTYFDEGEKILLDKLNLVLQKYSYDFFLGDKFSVVFALKRALIEENFSNIKNVLFLFNEVNANHYSLFKKSLNKLIPNINFDLEASFFHKKNLLTNCSNYDLIISDEKVNSNVFVIDFYCNSKVQGILEEKAFNIGLNKFCQL
ncbi:hypothetical protein NON08_06675 [Cetobacterium somerae]|uniref:hypothetical protein n=1 Tax=Cetobacterium sp. NK01 TaxID=2993530 RepID=UPI002116DE57|nr:hypothetical protein [Cetobacterium sp. NK01]MCQ8212209.1 hypothetical protein [Cetobacterium sp. NK01]